MSEVRNLHTDPHCYRTRGAWHGQYEPVGQKYLYRLADDGATRGSCFAWEPLSNAQLAGMIVYAHVVDASQSVLDHLGVEGAPTIISRDGWIAARGHAGVASNRTLTLIYGSFVLDEVAVYEPADWEQIYDLYQRGVLERPFFAGDTFGGGVSSPSLASAFCCACPRMGVCA